MTDHVFAESNFLFELFRPSYLRDEFAASIQRAFESGKIKLHIPSVCFIESLDTLKRKLRVSYDTLRKYVKAGDFSTDKKNVIFSFLEEISQADTTHLSSIPSSIKTYQASLRDGCIQFDERAANKVMLIREVESWGLKHFDEAVLACVSARAESIHANNTQARLWFVSQDKDLRDHNKNDEIHDDRHAFYRHHHLTYISTFEELVGQLNL